jgi:hypothetical protein
MEFSQGFPEREQVHLDDKEITQPLEALFSIESEENLAEVEEGINNIERSLLGDEIDQSEKMILISALQARIKLMTDRQNELFTSKDEGKVKLARMIGTVLAKANAILGGQKQ